MDYDYLSASDGSGDTAIMHILADRAVDSSTITVNTVAGVPAKFIATSGTLAPNGLLDPATKTDFKGHVSGGQLIIDGYMPGSTNNGNTEGQLVVIKPNTHWANKVATFIQNATGFGTPDNLFAKAMKAASLEVTGGPVTLPAKSVNGHSLNVTKSVDANGWTVWDFGAFKEYAKLVTYSGPISGNTTWYLSSNLPAGFSNMGAMGTEGVDYFIWLKHGGQFTEQVGWGLGQITPADTDIRFWYRNINSGAITPSFQDVLFIRN